MSAWEQLARTLALVALLGVCSCSSNGLVRPGSVQLDGLSLQPQREWSQRGVKGERQWTIDGPQLNALEIYSGIKDGQHVFKLRDPGERDEGLRFRAGMNALELQDLIVAGLLEAGAVGVESLQQSPAPIGNLRGFRFELSFANAQGLRYRSLGLAFVDQQRLQLLLYYAPAEYYFERDRGEVERIFDSLRWRGG